MANQTIPITLQPGTPPANFSYANFSQLLTAICRYVSGSIRADVSFFLEVMVTPTVYAGANLVYNSVQRVFKGWNPNTGSYVTITQYAIGDVKHSFVAEDDVQNGWVLLNGRAFTAVPGLNAAQIAALQATFGGTTLPTWTPVNGADLPASDSFSGITKPTINPGEYAFAGITVSDPPTQAEVQEIADLSQELRLSVGDVAAQASEIQDKSADLLEALRTNTTPPLVMLTFVGYP